MRLAVWAVVGVLVVIAGVANWIFCQTYPSLDHMPPRPWICLSALPAELQNLFQGDRQESYLIARGFGRRASDHVPVISLAVHLETFLDVQTRRELAANLSALPSLDNPYQATLEELAESSYSGWWKVSSELKRMRDDGHLPQLRYEQLQRRLKELNRRKKRI